MKILHTADLHLKKDKPEQLDILRWIIDTSNSRDVDHVIIAGDMFESDADASTLRSEVKKIFENAKASILIIPGNHDARAYNTDYDYGSRVDQITDTPFSILEKGGFRFVAVPFQDRSFSECIKNIPEDTDILIAHGTLYDPSFIFSVIDDIETKYMPIFPKNIENRARYVALGHLHSRFNITTYARTKAVYPGSPYALDTKCASPRAVALVTITDHDIKIERVDVDIAAYWDEKDFFVFPGNEDRVIEGIRQHLKAADPRRIQPHISIRGYISHGDKEYKRTIDTIETHFKPMFKDLLLDVSIESWDTLVQHRMVQRFIEKTRFLEEPVRMKLYEITFPILSKALQ